MTRILIVEDEESYREPLVYQLTREGYEVSAAATGEGEDIPAPLEGKFYRVKNTEETPKQPGDRVKAGDILGYIEAMKTYNAIRAEFDGTITAILVNSGDAVEEDDVIMKIAKQ